MGRGPWAGARARGPTGGEVEAGSGLLLAPGASFGVEIGAERVGAGSGGVAAGFGCVVWPGTAGVGRAGAAGRTMFGSGLGVRVRTPPGPLRETSFSEMLSRVHSFTLSPCARISGFAPEIEKIARGRSARTTIPVNRTSDKSGSPPLLCATFSAGRRVGLNKGRATEVAANSSGAGSDGRTIGLNSARDDVATGVCSCSAERSSRTITVPKIAHPASNETSGRPIITTTLSPLKYTDARRRDYRVSPPARQGEGEMRRSALPPR